MPFDALNYLGASAPEIPEHPKARTVYDKDNPPERMSEAIRMAVEDVEAMLAAGYGWDWDNTALPVAAPGAQRPI